MPYLQCVVTVFYGKFLLLTLVGCARCLLQSLHVSAVAVVVDRTPLTKNEEVAAVELPVETHTLALTPAAKAGELYIHKESGSLCTQQWC